MKKVKFFSLIFWVLFNLNQTSASNPVEKKITGIKNIKYEENPKPVMMYINFLLGFPSGEFRAKTNSFGWGINFGMGWQPLISMPLGIGADIGYLEYGKVSEDKTLTADITANGTVIDQLIIPLHFEITNSILSGHVFLRATAPIPIVKPYAQAVGGFNYFSTTTKITDNSDNHILSKPDDNVIVSKEQIGSTALSYGFGGGLLIGIGEDMYINVSGTYLVGGVAEYYDSDDTKDWKIEFNKPASQYNKSTLKGEDINLSAQPKKSTTNMVMIELGFFMNFSSDFGN